MAYSHTRLAPQTLCRRFFLTAIGLLGLITITPFLQQSEAQVSQYDLSARITFLLSKYTSWPANPGKDADDVLVGVYGNGAKNFAALNGEILKAHEIKVVAIDARTPAAVLSQCAVIFTSDGADLDRTAEATNGKPVFIVHLGEGNKKACVTLFQTDGKLAFEVNRGTLQKRKLQMSSQALKLAAKVNK
ncbi:MAG: hypothetical protein ACI8UO_006779 [Verrucomicrobiales bacterium]|jgi:hypothetical protein